MLSSLKWFPRSAVIKPLWTLYVVRKILKIHKFKTAKAGDGGLISQTTIESPLRTCSMRGGVLEDRLRLFHTSSGRRQKFLSEESKIEGIWIAAGSLTILTKSSDLHDYHQVPRVDAGGPDPRTPPPATPPRCTSLRFGEHCKLPRDSGFVPRPPISFPHFRYRAFGSELPLLTLFTARRSYASAVVGVVILSVCPSVCPSVTRVLCD